VEGPVLEVEEAPAAAIVGASCCTFPFICLE
jgi:hypothetical protein